ncbi:MAG: dihydroorotase [Thermoplasmatota archaeon]
MHDMVIKGRLLEGGSWVEAAVCVSNGRITRISREDPGRNSAGEYLNFGRKLILPGVIDTHVHMRDPGLTAKEDFGTGTISAAFGGVTTVLDMPNTIPPVIDRRSFLMKTAEANRKSHVDFGLYLGIVDGTDEAVLRAAAAGDWSGMRPAAFKCFLGESTGKLTISRIEDIGLWRGIVSESGKPLAVHPEDGDILIRRKGLSDGGSILERHYSRRPPEAEMSAVKRAVKAMGPLTSSLHLLHVSSEIGLRAASGTGASVEVTPHHLLLDIERCENLERSEYAKVNPPIRKRSDRAALWKGIGDGIVNTIGSDHAPHELESKTHGIESPSGMPGVETMLPLLIAKTLERKLSFPRLQDLLCGNPASIFDLKAKGSISPGKDADMIVIDPDEGRVIRSEELHSKCGWTPYEGMRGVFPTHVFSRGELITENGVLCAKGGRGRLLC